MPSARCRALENQNTGDYDLMGTPPPKRSALAEWCSRPPPRPRSAITIDPDTDAAAILRRVLNEPLLDKVAEESAQAEDISSG